MQAEILPDVLLKEKLKGEVIAVDRIGDTASNTFGVKLSMPNPDNRIPAGLKCVVKFLEAPEEQVAEAKAPEEQAAEKLVIAESPNEAGSETPKGLIARPTEATEPEAGAVKLSSTKIARPSELLAAIRDANATDVSAAAPARADDSLAGQDQLAMQASLAKTPTSYMVLIGKQETKAATQDFVDRLRDAGINDFMVLMNGSNKGLISLGIFGTRAAAVNRQQALDQLGFTSFTIERYQ